MLGGEVGLWPGGLACGAVCPPVCLGLCATGGLGFPPRGSESDGWPVFPAMHSLGARGPTRLQDCAPWGGSEPAPWRGPSSWGTRPAGGASPAPRHLQLRPEVPGLGLASAPQSGLLVLLLQPRPHPRSLPSPGAPRGRGLGHVLPASAQTGGTWPHRLRGQ